MFLIVQPNGEYRLGAGKEIGSADYFFYQEGAVAIHGSQIVLTPQICNNAIPLLPPIL